MSEIYQKRVLKFNVVTFNGDAAPVLALLAMRAIEKYVLVSTGDETTLTIYASYPVETIVIKYGQVVVLDQSGGVEVMSGGDFQREYEPAQIGEAKNIQKDTPAIEKRRHHLVSMAEKMFSDMEAVAGSMQRAREDHAAAKRFAGIFEIGNEILEKGGTLREFIDRTK